MGDTAIEAAKAPEEKPVHGKMGKKARRAIGITVSLLLVLAIGGGIILPLCLIHPLYSDVFAGHFTVPEAKLLDYPELERVETVKFPSNMGQILSGSFYCEKEAGEPRGLIVVSHGIGGGGQGGHLDYLGTIAYFARQGFLVFGFDNTGYGSSEGENRSGLSQAPVDLEFALLYLESREELKGLPLMLYGHSWGGFAVCSVLSNEHDIRAVVSQSGFNRASDLLLEEGRKMIGEQIPGLGFYLYLYEHLKFGRVVDNTAAKGLRGTDAKTLVLWGDQDEVISEEYSIYGHREEYAENPNVTVELLPGNRHNGLTDEQISRIGDFFVEAAG